MHEVAPTAIMSSVVWIMIIFVLAVQQTFIFQSSQIQLLRKGIQDSKDPPRRGFKRLFELSMRDEI